jgi:hypothetical protein
VLPGNDPPNWRSELPRLEKEPPVGYRPGWQWEERLQGLGVFVLGVIGLIVAYLMFNGVLPVGLPPPKAPPGVLVPVFNPTGCLVPLIGLMSVAMIVLGLKRAIDP